MSDIRIEKVLIGSPTYKVVVGDYTKVKRVVVGTPTRNVFVATDADFNELRGLDISGRLDGDLLIYNDSSGLWESKNILDNNQVIDGRFYNQDSVRAQILTRRSRTEGIPDYLREGELAYSQLANAGTDGIGNGGERLYMGIGLESVVDGILQAESIHIIGGKYFTDLLNHTHGILTPSSAVIVDSAKRINEWLTTDLTVYNDAILTNLVVDSARVVGTLTVDTLFANNINIPDLFLDLTDILREGQAIDLIIDSAQNTITIAAELATYDNLGVASFGAYADSALTQRQFAVDSGQVSILYIDGGFFAYDSAYG